MPVLETKNLGPISYEPDAVIDFPRGLPAFESLRSFAAVQFADSVPLVFLQSLEDAGVSFVCLPVLTVDPQYRVEISAEDLASVGLSAAAEPRIGHDVLCLVVLTLLESGPTANLLAPVVVNLHNRKAVQAVVLTTGRSHQHILLPEEHAAPQRVAQEALCS